MSLTAALKKGLSVANSGGELKGDWDPYPDQGEGDKPAPRSNAAVVRSPSAAKAEPGSSRAPLDTKGSLRKTGALKAIDGTKAAPSSKSAAPAPQVASQTAPQPAARPAAAPHQRPASPMRRPANQAGPAAQPAPNKDDKRPNWLGNAGVAVGHVNPAQYARELDRFAADEQRRAVSDTLLDVRSTEIEGVAKLAARIKSRYLAKLLDVGNPSKSGVQETEIKELARYRETYEELGRGLDMLKDAIESGDVTVSGMIRR
jgi:hypothetical protein